MSLPSKRMFVRLKIVSSCLSEKKTWKGLRGRMKRELSFPVHSSFDYSFHENSGASKYLDIFVYIKMTIVIPVLTSSVWPSFVMECYTTSKNNMVHERYFEIIDY